MVSVDNDIGLLLLSAAVFIVVVGVAVRVAWTHFCPDFRERYGDERGPMMLAFFFVSFPVLVVAHLVARWRGDKDTARDR